MSEETATKKAAEGGYNTTPQTKEVSYSMSKPGDMTGGTADSARWHMLKHLQDELDCSNPKLFIEDNSSNEVQSMGSVK